MPQRTNRTSPCALVLMEDADRGQVTEVVMPFASPAEADDFARRHGLGGVVAPAVFAVEWADPPQEAGLRPVLVVDGDGEVAGTFGTEPAAHAWAHARAGQQGTPLPVRVEELAARRTWEIRPDSCRSVTWTVGVTGPCREHVGRPDPRPSASMEPIDRYRRLQVRPDPVSD